MTGAEVEKAAEEAGQMYWPVPGLVPPFTFLLAGDPKAGKTTVALDIAWNVASGNPALGSVPTHLGDVLYVAAETGSASLDYMRRDLWPAEDWPARLSLIPMERFGQMGMKLMDVLDMWHGSVRRPTLVIIDTLGKAILGPAERRAPSSSVYSREYAAMDHLTQWSSRNMCSVMTLHHTNKQMEKNLGHWAHAISGSQGLTGATEDYALLQRRKDDDDAPGKGLRLRAEGRSFAGEQDWTIMRNNRSLVMFDTIEFSPRHGSKMKAVAECAFQFWPTVTVQDIVDHLELSPSTVRVYCKRLVDKGVFERVGSGEYRIKQDSRGQA
jgi:hypothetical protein